MKTEISEDDFANAKRVNEGGIWRPRRDLNPCYRRERPVSWAELDDGDVLVSRAGFEPATLCLKVLAVGESEDRHLTKLHRFFKPYRVNKRLSTKRIRRQFTDKRRTTV